MTCPRGTKFGTKGAQGGPSWPLEPLNEAPEAPRWAQEAPRWIQEAPRGVQEAPERANIEPKRRQLGPKRRQLEPKRLPKASTEMTQTHRPRPHDFLCLSVQVFFCRPRFHKCSYIGKARMSFFLLGSTNFPFCAFTPNHFFTIDTADKKKTKNHFFGFMLAPLLNFMIFCCFLFIFPSLPSLKRFFEVKVDNYPALVYIDFGTA